MQTNLFSQLKALITSTAAFLFVASRNFFKFYQGNQKQLTKAPKPSFGRIAGLFFGIFVLFCLLIYQFFNIQIIEGEKWTKVARKQHFFIIHDPFLRGRFISNTDIKKGHPHTIQSFVTDIQKFHLYVDPESIPDAHKNAISSNLVALLDLSLDEKQKMRSQFDRKSRSRKLAMWLDHDERDAVFKWWLPYAKKYKIPRNALFFLNDYQRSYPFGKLLGQVLHTIQNNKDETTKQAVPTGGLELYFNKYLQGKQGKRRLMRSPRNSFETGEVLSLPENGADIYLTINHCLQAIAEEEIEKGVKKAKAKSGWAVMMDPRSGEILVLAQYPGFSPSDYSLYFSNPKLIDDTRIKAATDAFEPGSVLKPFTLAVALKANEALQKEGKKPIFSPEAKIATSNGRFKGRPKPLSDTHIHYFLNMEMALQKSTNIYMARLVESIVNTLGIEWYRDNLCKTFGLGTKTGLELPGESCGIVPTPGKKHANGTFEWSASTPYSTAIGHNIQTTSLQLVRAYAVFANGGYLVKPTLVRKIVKTSQDNVQTVIVDNTQRSLEAQERVLDPETINTVIRAMKYVTKPGGTAPRANVWGYTEAGKTATANKIISGKYSPTQYYASFVGFTPITNPAFVLLVTLDEPEYGFLPGIGKTHHGGNCAAPIFKEIATRSLAYLGVPSDDPHGYPNGDPRFDADKADWILESRKLQEKYDSWNKSK